MDNRSMLFDYIIIGNGLAGLQLALALTEDLYFKDKQIALIDKNDKTTNDKTWCYWEKGNGKWDKLVHNSWGNADVYTTKNKHQLKLAPYRYKMIRSIDFYNDVKTKLKKKDNIHFIIDNVLLTKEESSFITVTTSSNTYKANHVFDSRIEHSFFSEKKEYINIIQHFKGWVIETPTSTFNSLNTFTMMDYRLKDGEQTTFMYVLPFSKNKALVEFTYFTSNIVEDEIYNTFLKRYISNILKVNSYNILEIEKGSIPMTNFPFNKYSTNKLTKIGTGGGWVKGSTGYSFKHTEKKVSQIIKNLKQDKSTTFGLFNRRFKFYDKVFLKVLLDENK
ncbi:lycopene cyclase family protein, partial [Pontimicrobium sp. MEBiC01747]